MSKNKINLDISQNSDKDNLFSPINKVNTYHNKSEYSPYVIKHSNFQSNSNIKSHLHLDLTAKTLQMSNSKLYIPSSHSIKLEKLNDRYIPLKQGLNLIEKFNMAKNYKVNGCKIETENNNPNTIQDYQEMTYDKLLKQNILNDSNKNDMYSHSNKGLVYKDEISNIFSFRS